MEWLNLLNKMDWSYYIISFLVLLPVFLFFNQLLLLQSFQNGSLQIVENLHLYQLVRHTMNLSTVYAYITVLIVHVNVFWMCNKSLRYQKHAFLFLLVNMIVTFYIYLHKQVANLAYMHHWK